MTRTSEHDTDQGDGAPDPLTDDDWVPLPNDTDGGRRVLALVVGAVLVLAITIGGLVFWVSRKIDPPGEPGAVVASIEIPTGSSNDSIGEILADAGVVGDGGLFARYTGLKGEGPWEAGEYVEFRENSSFDEAISVLDAGPLPVGASKVRVTEGKRLTDALDQIAEQHPNVTVEDLLLALGSGEVTSKYLPEGSTSWEGLLFPDTYEFSDDATATQILQTLADQMVTVMDELGYERAEALRGLGAYELVTVASMAERETGSPEEERGQIARVIYNRLDDGEPLGIDATILYGLGRNSGELTKSELEADSPYNSRLNAGLPPTPIGLPGRASLQAAIDPPTGDWRFYVLVSNDPPSHLFTESYSEFQQAKAEAQADGVF